MNCFYILNCHLNKSINIIDKILFVLTCFLGEIDFALIKLSTLFNNISSLAVAVGDLNFCFCFDGDGEHDGDDVNEDEEDMDDELQDPAESDINILVLLLFSLLTLLAV